MIGAPINLIMGDATLRESGRQFLILLLWLPFLALAVRFMWKKGNLQYTGVGM